MSAKTTLEQFTWEAEATRKRARALRELPATPPHEEKLSLVAEWAGPTPAEQWEQLRNEIRRAREYLAQVREDLAESRLALEQWPAFECHCGNNPLAKLTENVVVQERVESFLQGWLCRREQQLDDLSAAMAIASTVCAVALTEPLTGS